MLVLSAGGWLAARRCCSHIVRSVREELPLMQVVYRPHPMLHDRTNFCLEMDETVRDVTTRTDQDETLEEALAGAAVAISVSSSAAVEASKQASELPPSLPPSLPLSYCDGSLTLPLFKIFILVPSVSVSLCMLRFSPCFCTRLLLEQSIIRGIPTITLDFESPTYSVSCHSFSMLKDIVIEGSACRPPREQWLYNLAYVTWSTHDVENGNLFHHLFRTGHPQQLDEAGP